METRRSRHTQSAPRLLYGLLPCSVLSGNQRNEIYKPPWRPRLRGDDFDLTSADQGYGRGPVDGFAHRPTQSWTDFSIAGEVKYWVQWWPRFSAGDASALRVRRSRVCEFYAETMGRPAHELSRMKDR